MQAFSVDTWQMSNRLLRRDAIWFVEKDDSGISTLYSLADFIDEDGSRILKDEKEMLKLKKELNYDIIAYHSGLFFAFKNISGT